MNERSAEEQLADLKERVDNAQRLADMGDYDWHIPSDTNTWSDQLYRIYGHEPQSFNPSYETFLSFIHPEDRDRIRAIHERAYATGEPYEMVERIVRPDGEIRYLASNGQVIMGEDGAPVRMRGTCIDITDRVLAEQEMERAAAEREELAVRVREAAVRRRQALEINDNVVQSLAAAVYALRAGDVEAADQHVRHTLRSARGMMEDLLESLDGDDLVAGDLVRANAAAETALVTPPTTAPPSPGSAAGATRVLVADDSADLRVLLQVMLTTSSHFEWAGEAADGAEAIDAAARLEPDLVLLDLSMPVMDGLQALPRLRDVLPDVVVVVLSGFDESSMGHKAMAAGADAYLEKGGALEDLEGALRGVLERRAVAG